MPNKGNKQSSPISLSLGEIAKRVILVLIFIVIIAGIIYENIGDRKLRNKSDIVMGIVYDKGSTRRTSNVRHYQFWVNGEKFRGMSSCDSKLEINDSIKVVYYPDDPRINCSWNAYIRNIKE